MNFANKMMVGVVLSAVATVAQAASIDGSFGFTGNFTPLGGSTADTATGIDFPAPTGRISTCGGSYTSIFSACDTFTGDIYTVTDIASGTLPASGGVAYSALNWLTTSNFAFDLLSITDVLRDSAGLTSLRITGTGMAHTTVAGFDPTPGTFIFTFNGNGPSQFTFSSSVTTAAVPEPTTLALLGLGLAGLGLSRRRKAN